MNLLRGTSPIESNGFTFQYGQIMNHFLAIKTYKTKPIYIPIWLDYECWNSSSNAGGFYIYIPIWLDYEYYTCKQQKTALSNLHSNMVRL